MIGRLLCWLGFHRWKVWSEPLGGEWHRDHMVCQRPSCDRHFSYTTHRTDEVNW